MEIYVYKLTNGFSLSLNVTKVSKSLKQVSVQNMLGCSIIVFWSIGPCIVLEPIRGQNKGCDDLRLQLTYMLGFIFSLNQSIIEHPLSLVMKLNFHDLNHTSSIVPLIEVSTFKFLLVLFISQQRLSFVLRSIESVAHLIARYLLFVMQHFSISINFMDHGLKQ